jgi:hypothetical protein
MTANEGARVRTSRFWPARAGLNAIVSILAAGTLAGCSFSDGVASFLVDPAQYSVYHCKDLVAQLKTLLDRQKELRDLMGKANEGGGGTVIGALTYRTEYEKVVGEEKLLRRTADKKQCDLGQTYQSDQMIR